MSKSLHFSDRSDVGRHLAALDAKGRLSATETAELRELLVRLDQVLGKIESAEQQHFATQFLLGLDQRLRVVENSAIFRALRWGHSVLGSAKVRVKRMVQQSLLRYISKRPSLPGADPLYEEYLSSREHIPRFGLRFIGHQSRRSRNPRFSLLMAVSRADPWMLGDSIDSILSQQYANWELMIVAYGTDSPLTWSTLESKARQDPRIVLFDCPEVDAPAEALELAAQSSNGNYLALLRQHDQFLPGALMRISEAIMQHGAEIVYTDEDQMDSVGRLSNPVFKPAWSPELLRQHMYLGRGYVVDAKLYRACGGLRLNAGNSFEHSLALRLAEKRPSVCHIPEVLFRSRDEAHKPAKPGPAFSLERRIPAAKNGLHRDTSTNGSSVGKLASGASSNGTERAMSEAVTIVICTKSAKLLRRCLKGIADTAGAKPPEIIVVNHLPDERAEVSIVAQRHGCRLLPYTGPFNFSRMNNLACMRASGDVYIFLNDDTVPVVPNWVQILAKTTLKSGVGAVGARLIYPSGAIQHAGIALGLMDGVGHPLRGTTGGKYWPWDAYRREVSAVTGACLAIRRTAFEDVGGFDPRFPKNYSDVDLCLRLRAKGYSILYEPAAELIHLECATRDPTVTGTEKQRFYSLWGNEIEQGDPFYNPNLSVANEDASLRMDFE